MIDHSKDRCRQGVDMVLGKTRFGGFFFVRRKLQLLQEGQVSGAEWSMAYM
jgi:hypothetical protein